MISYIVKSIDEKYTVYSDLPGHTAPGGGSIPPELCVTAQKPDIVIIDNHKKVIHLYELTCPAERNIDTRNTEKSNKYAHFTTDITHLSCKVNCFEVSTKGFLSTRNHSTLNTLHKFVKPNITKSQFKSNISALSLTASYHIFLCKDEPTFSFAPLPPSTLCDQEGCGLLLIEYTYGAFCVKWDQQPVSGQCIYCFNPLSGCPLCMTNLFVIM